MIKKFIIKKLAIFLISLTSTIIVFSCNAKDDKNKEETYSTIDTSQPLERKNDNAMLRDSMSSRIP
ncbi:MAG: hypothetical protein ACXVNM_13695 [Bacteroidia bacterium]